VYVLRLQVLCSDDPDLPDVEVLYSLTSAGAIDAFCKLDAVRVCSCSVPVAVAYAFVCTQQWPQGCVRVGDAICGLAWVVGVAGERRS
jgi:hypothetical protein